MDKPQSETSSSKTATKDSTAVGRDVASALLTIERILQRYDAEFNNHKLTIVKSLQTCYRVERCVLTHLAYCEELLPMICTTETNLARARWNLADMEERVRSIDRRRPNDKRTLKRQNLVEMIAETQQTINDLVNLLSFKKTNVATFSADLKSIQESVNADKSLVFKVAKVIKQKRQEIIVDRNELLAFKKALEDNCN